MARDVKSGWERERRTHFDEIAESYDRIRPDFPAAMSEDIAKYAGVGREALEIGAGTGKATAPFLRAGYDVTAVEIGANMAGFLREKFEGEYSGFRVINAAFEEAGLEEARYDLVYAASAFHWIDASVGCPKALNILKPGGAFALMRYNFNIVPAEGEELHDELREVYARHYDSYYTYYKTHKQSVKLTHELLKTPDKLRSGYGFRDMREYGFGEVVVELYDAVLKYGADEFIALLETMSDHRALPDDNREALYAGVREAIERNGDSRAVDFIFQLYMGRKPRI